MVKATNTDAIEQASGQDWPTWTAHLDALGGEDLDHAALAAAAATRLRELGTSSPDWWAQGIAVAYEQAIGRRAPGQRADGTHEVSVSKTFGRDLDHALEAWGAAMAQTGDGSASGDGGEHRGVALGEAQVTTSEKWRYWRAEFADGTKLLATIGLRANGKPYAAVTHSAFADGDGLPEWKAYWRERLADAAAHTE